MTQVATAVDERARPRRAGKRVQSRFLEVWVRLIREKPLGLLGASIVFGMLGLAVFADVIAPYGYAQTNLLHTASRDRACSTGWGRTNWAAIC